MSALIRFTYRAVAALSEVAQVVVASFGGGGGDPDVLRASDSRRPKRIVPRSSRRRLARGRFESCGINQCRGDPGGFASPSSSFGVAVSIVAGLFIFAALVITPWRPEWLQRREHADHLSGAGDGATAADLAELCAAVQTHGGHKSPISPASHITEHWCHR